MWWVKSSVLDIQKAEWATWICTFFFPRRTLQWNTRGTKELLLKLFFLSPRPPPPTHIWLHHQQSEVLEHQPADQHLPDTTARKMEFVSQHKATHFQFITSLSPAKLFNFYKSNTNRCFTCLKSWWDFLSRIYSISTDLRFPPWRPFGKTELMEQKLPYGINGNQFKGSDSNQRFKLKAKHIIPKSACYILWCILNFNSPWVKLMIITLHSELYAAFNNWAQDGTLVLRFVHLVFAPHPSVFFSAGWQDRLKLPVEFQFW